MRAPKKLTRTTTVTAAAEALAVSVSLLAPMGSWERNNVIAALVAYFASR